MHMYSLIVLARSLKSELWTKIIAVAELCSPECFREKSVSLTLPVCRV